MDTKENKLTNTQQLELEKIKETFIIESIVRNNDKINDIIKNKLVVKIDDKQVDKVKKILEYLVTANPKLQNSVPIKNIIDRIKHIFSDGKLDAYDIPAIIEVITETLNMNLSNIKVNIDIKDTAILIKLIIFIMVESKIVNINDEESANINKLIDSSMKLLESSIKISKCSCFSWCKKK